MLALKASRQFNVRISPFVLLCSILCFWQQGDAMSSRPKLVKKGVWGGEHAGMRVESKGALIEYDCAHGTIEQVMSLDGKGRFRFTGTYTLERGGPSMEDEMPDTHPAIYTGRITGSRMIISVTLTDTRQTFGPYTLIYGKTPILMKCR
jgi:hypothetical protein